MDERLICEKIELLDKQTGEPVYRQLADIILGLIEEKQLRPDDRLPTIRALSKALNVNKSTVVNAYRLLESKKAVYAVTGSGTYVSDVKAGDAVSPPKIYEPEDCSEGAINFANAATSANLFPVEQFKRLFNQVLERDKGDAFGYEDSRGYLPLREALCGYLSGFGINTSADRLQIISGAQQGVDIISKAVLSNGDSVVVETPTYYGAVGSFISRGASVIGAPMEYDGIDTAKLEALVKAYRPKLVYVMPYFQTPTCVTYSVQKKRALLEMAAKYDFYIVEEDNQSDFSIGEKPVIPLKALDYKNRVIYIKSFSKILMPGLRLGVLVLPKAVLTRVLSAKYTADVETSGFIQRAFELFIKSGEWDSHVLRMRDIYRRRYEVMISCSRRCLKGRLSFSPPGGGLCVWYRLPDGVCVTDFCNRLIKCGVIVTPGDAFSLHNEKTQNIRLSFAALEEAEIAEGIKKIAFELADYMIQ